jgi:hypothetical protein
MKKIFTSPFLTCALLSIGISNATEAQSTQTKTVNKPYFSTNIDGLILSTTVNSKAPVSGNSLTTPRFTGFFHIGFNLNYDFTKGVGIFTGVNIKNIGFIEKYNNPDSTVKRRVYTFGVPLGFKFGNLKYGSFLIAGGGVDFPFNYKEKGFIHRGHKEKFNEWFSSRTPAAMPYVFIGAVLRPVMSIKLQYYPSNFMNENYTTTQGSTTVTPYKGYDVKLIMLTVGFDINYRPRS